MTREERDYIIYQWAIGADKEHICNCGNFYHFNKDKDNDKPLPPIPIEPIYRWSASTETICIDNSLYEKEYQYVSYDKGITWDNTLNSRLGDIIEENSAECGYEEPIEPIYEWVIDNTDHICIDYIKYNKEKYYVSYDNGDTWQYTGQERRGNIIEEDSTDCGYIEPIKEYVTVSLNDEWRISSNKLEGYQVYESFSNYHVIDSKADMRILIPSGITEFAFLFGSNAESSFDYTLIGHLDADMSSVTSTETGTTSDTWKDSSKRNQSESAPNIRATYIIDNPSVSHFIDIRYVKDNFIDIEPDRGYIAIPLVYLGLDEPLDSTDSIDPIDPIEPIYEWRTSEEEYICDNGYKYEKQYRYVSYDNGITWNATDEEKKGKYIEASIDCGYMSEWRICEGEYRCLGTSKYQLRVLYVSKDYGNTWKGGSEKILGNLIERNSADCGYTEKIYDWRVNEDEYICDEATHTKYRKEYQYESSDNGNTWNITEVSRQGDVLEDNSIDCGYIEPIIGTKFSPTTNPVTINDKFVFIPSLQNGNKSKLIGEYYDSRKGEVRLYDRLISKTGDDMKDCIWQLVSIGRDSENIYKIRNQKGHYIGKCVPPPTYNKGVLITSNIDEAATIRIGKGCPHLKFTDNYALQEQDIPSIHYGLNNLNDLKTEINWFTKDDVFSVETDSNIYFDLYKVI